MGEIKLINYQIKEFVLDINLFVAVAGATKKGRFGARAAKRGAGSAIPALIINYYFAKVYPDQHYMQTLPWAGIDLTSLGLREKRLDL